jgi:hypothetical protein
VGKLADPSPRPGSLNAPHHTVDSPCASYAHVPLSPTLVVATASVQGSTQARAE